MIRLNSHLAVEGYREFSKKRVEINANAMLVTQRGIYAGTAGQGLAFLPKGEQRWRFSTDRLALRERNCIGDRWQQSLYRYRQWFGSHCGMGYDSMKFVRASLSPLLLGLSLLARADSGVIIPAGKQSPDSNILAVDSLQIRVVIDNGHATVHLQEIFHNKAGGVWKEHFRSACLPQRQSPILLFGTI